MTDRDELIQLLVNLHGPVHQADAILTRWRLVPMEDAAAALCEHPKVKTSQFCPDCGTLVMVSHR